MKTVAVRPQDDFYLYVNADWTAHTPIPPDLPWISPFVENTLRVQSRTRVLIEEAAAGSPAAGTDAQRIGDLYRSYADEAAIEKKALTPLRSELARIDAIRSPSDLAVALATLGQRHASTDPNSILPDVAPVVVAVRADARDTKKPIATLVPAGLGMPGRAYYLDAGERPGEVRAAYRQHVADTLRLSGVPDPIGAAERVMALETSLARAELSEEQLHDPDATFHPTWPRDLDRLYPGLPWQEFLRAANLGDVRELVVSQPGQLGAVASAARGSLGPWRDYLRWQLLRRYAPFLPRAYGQANHQFYDRVLLGAEVQRPRAELAGLLVEGALAESVGLLYVERYLQPGAKRDVATMAEQVRVAFADRIRAADWLAPPTKRAALEKLSKLLVKVAYPDRWESFSDVTIRPDDLIGNLVRLSEHAYRIRLARLGRPVDRTRWLDVPQSTNAYYNRSTNELAIPAGYLQAPWYDAAATPAVNYGGIGTVIGHEMGHAFDDQGSRYDGDGNVRNWWTVADRTRFEAKAAELVRQYDAFEPLPGQRVNGRLTVSENIGDLTGLTLGYTALVRAVPAVGDIANDRDRTFFTSFCTHWRAKYREPLLRRILASDGHPPQQYRCNGPLTNFGPFYSLYSLESSDQMFRPAPARVTLW